MLRIIFNISKFQTKFFLAIIIIIIFTILNMAVPRDEFQKLPNFNGDEKEISYLDLIQYSVLSQVGIQNVILYPKSVRTRIMSMIQLFIGYSIILM